MLIVNPNAGPSNEYGPALQAILNQDDFEAARREITGWPGYETTPLVSLPGLAAASGLGAIYYKDESGRFGLGSFKALGGAYAVAKLVRSAGKDITVCSATDGNHGRSVAWGAQVAGCRCVIYIHAHVSEGRQRAIENFGAEVRRVLGNYDDSVHQAADDSAANGWYVVSDTSWPGYRDVPCDVMHGYTVMAGEVMDQLPDGKPPTHIFAQGGVGGLAAAVLAPFWQRYGADRPRFVVAEPDNAACLFESAKAGTPTVVHGDLDTVMAGLAAGEVSLLAWDILWAGCDGFATVGDDTARDLMRKLAHGCDGDPAVVAGESAVAGLAAAIEARRDGALGLDGNSRLLVIGSEGATDPALYHEIVGRSADEVRGAS